VTRLQRNRVLNFAGFQLGWLVCIGFSEQTWIGVVTVLSLLVVHALAVVDDRREWQLMLLIVLTGCLIDAVLGRVGILIYPEQALLPLWLVLLWVLFSTLIRHSLSWLQSRLLLAAALAAISAPASYWAGARLTGTEFGGEPGVSLLVIALYWALLLPASLWLAQRWLGGYARD
jgi:hypothetical protein